MNQQGTIDWNAIKREGSKFPEAAFDFVREGLEFTVQTLRQRQAAAGAGPSDLDEPRHVSGVQLCEGLKELAINRYGLLARTVLSRWGVTRTDDFGTIVYCMIATERLRASDDDSPEHFRAVYAFDGAFPEPKLN